MLNGLLLLLRGSTYYSDLHPEGLAELDGDMAQTTEMLPGNVEAVLLGRQFRLRINVQ